MKRPRIPVVLNWQFRQRTSFPPDQLSLVGMHCSKQTLIVLRDICYFLIQNLYQLVSSRQSLLELILRFQADMNFILKPNNLLFKHSNKFLLLRNKLFCYSVRLFNIRTVIYQLAHRTIIIIFEFKFSDSQPYSQFYLFSTSTHQ